MQVLTFWLAKHLFLTNGIVGTYVMVSSSLHTQSQYYYLFSSEEYSCIYVAPKLWNCPFHKVGMKIAHFMKWAIVLHNSWIWQFLKYCCTFHVWKNIFHSQNFPFYELRLSISWNQIAHSWNGQFHLYSSIQILSLSDDSANLMVPETKD